MTENSVITLFRPNSGASGLLCLGTVPAWVNREEVIKNDGRGIYTDDNFDIRIKRKCVKNIKPGDLVFFGRAESSCVRASECRRIAAVTLNEVGTNPHWHLRSEYRYR